MCTDNIMKGNSLILAWFNLVSTLSFFVCVQGQPNINSIELNALYDFYVATNGQNWNWKNTSNVGPIWNFSVPNPNPCNPQWQGLKCDCNLLDCIVSRFDLEDYNLVGSIPNSIDDFSDLIIMKLGNNYLTGSLPSFALSNPVVIDVSYNFISDVSSVCNTSLLEVLDCTNNQLTGQIPSCLLELELLFVVDLSYNQLTGPIPEVGENHLPLGELQLSNNMLTDSIPYSLCHWNMEVLDLGFNALEGSLPSCNLTVLDPNGYNLNYFTINDNLISGTVPEYIQIQSKLAALTINNNKLSGTLPSFANATMVEFIYVQNNQFHGSLRLGTNFSSIEYVDISNNHLSGSLPGEFFSSTLTLKSFAASSNCITGYIPSSICNVENLLFLDLDGLTTADQCRAPIFPHFKHFQSYTLPNRVQGGIPECLFTMPKLQTLHISGNSIEWSFPSTMVSIDAALGELSLSHNKLTGTIPTVIQHRQWNSLDLSYNKLKGSLSFVDQVDANASIVLQVNRLSGVIPESLITLDSVNILTGNLFSCRLNRDDLPDNDKAYETYQCGSSTFNEASIIWLCCAAVFVGIFAIAWMSRHYWESKFEAWFKRIWETMQTHMSVFDNRPESRQLHQFKMFAMSIRNTMIILTLGILIVFLPTYGVLTAYFKTVEHQYAWTVSAAFLSGETPALTLLALYLCLILALFVLWLLFTDQLGRLQQTNESPVNKNTTTGGYRISQRVALFLVVVFNCAIMVLVNVAYVLVILNYNTVITFFAQVATALFKLLWNDFAVRGLILVARKAYNFSCCKKVEAPSADADDAQVKKNAKLSIFGAMDAEIDDEEERGSNSAVGDTEDGDALYVLQEMPYLAFIVLFNCIVAPCLATAAVDSNCLFNVFEAPSKVSTNFPITNAVITCDYEFLDQAVKSFCNLNATASSIEVSYDPPFIYSYQCTSSILTNYASVYVFMFLMVTFFKPVVLYVMLRYHTWLKTGSVIHAILDTTIYNLMTSAPLDRVKRYQKTGKHITLFHRERFVLRSVGKIAVFVTFGVIFPPLAVVMCAAFTTETHLNLLIVGRFLTKINDDSMRNLCRDLLNKDCEDCADLLLVPLVRLVVPFAAIFYGFFVFDIYGDQVGVRRALWAPLLLIFFPIFLWFLHSGYHWVHSRPTKSNKSGSVSSLNNVEIMSASNALRNSELQ